MNRAVTERAVTRGRWPTVEAEGLGWITTEDMIEVDRVMIEDLHIELIQMMENAGRGLAHLVVGLFPDVEAATVFVGPGGNGGGGLVAARHLHNLGRRVKVVLSREPTAFAPVPRHQLDIVERLGIPVAHASVETTEATRPEGVVVDAIIGYSLSGEPRGASRQLIESIGPASDGEAVGGVVSLDVPSGLDTTTGVASGAHVTADATLTLAQPKIGLRGAAAVGRLFVADLSVPPGVYDGIGMTGATPPFHQCPIVEILDGGSRG